MEIEFEADIYNIFSNLIFDAGFQNLFSVL